MGNEGAIVQSSVLRSVVHLADFVSIVSSSTKLYMGGSECLDP